jgi:hypothetical protein
MLEHMCFRRHDRDRCWVRFHDWTEEGAMRTQDYFINDLDRVSRLAGTAPLPTD